MRRFVQKALQKYVERFKVDPRKVAHGDPVSNLLRKGTCLLFCVWKACDARFRHNSLWCLMDVTAVRVPDDLERVQRRKFKVATVRGRGRTRSQGPDDSMLESAGNADGAGGGDE